MKDMRSKFEAIYAAMNHMGDVLNGMDAVEEDDEDKTEPGFIAIRELLAESAQGEQEPIAWLESEESARGGDPREIFGKHSMLWSTRINFKKPVTSNPIWPLYLAAPLPQGEQCHDCLVSPDGQHEETCPEAAAQPVQTSAPSEQGKVDAAQVGAREPYGYVLETGHGSSFSKKRPDAALAYLWREVFVESPQCAQEKLSKVIELFVDYERLVTDHDIVSGMVKYNELHDYVASLQSPAAQPENKPCDQ